MRRLIAAALFAGLVVVWGADRQPADVTRPVVWSRSLRAWPPPLPTLRIASYNIHSGRGRDGKLDLQRIASDLENLDFDALQEVRALLFSEQTDQAAVLGEALGMNSAFLPTERRWWHDHFGNAMLTNLPIESLQHIPLVNTRGKAYRQAILADVPLGDQQVHLLMAHLDSQDDREAQLQAVIQLFEALAAPAILMGDLNSGADDPQIVALLSRPGVESVLDADAGQHIDWIIVRGLECVAAEGVDSGASDHPVVKATLRLP